VNELSIIVLSYNTKDLTLKCLQTIFENKGSIKPEVWVVDNNSTDGSCEAIKKKYPQVSLIKSDKNLGFSGGNNLALKKINSSYSLLLNSDTELLPGALDNLIESAGINDFAVASCKIINKDGSLQPNAGELPSFFPMFIWLSGLDDIVRKIWPVNSYQSADKSYYLGEKEVGWVSGSVMLIRKDVFEDIGYLDEKIFMYGEDVEFCLRAKKAKFKIGWTEKAEIIHLGGGSSLSPRYNQWVGEFKGLLYIYNKYYGVLAALMLKGLFYIFIAARAVSFLILGRMNYAKTYAKIFINL